MRDIPGFRWDETTKRYYKDDGRARVSAAVPPVKKTLSAPPSRKSSNVEDSRSTTPLQKTSKSFNRVETNGSTISLLDVAATKPSSDFISTLLRQKSIVLSFACLQPTRTEEPNLASGDNITCFDFDKDNSEIIRYGTSQGLIGRGFISEAPRPIGHSVDAWHVEHMLGAPITSLHTDAGFMVATSFGPVAQAIIGRTDAQAHIKLAPRKTSLWSSAICNKSVALGCDKKLLFSKDPTSQSIQSYGTGSAVFALKLHQDRLLVGTRSGRLQSFDLRMAGHSDETFSRQSMLRLDSPIINIHTLGNGNIIVARMNGSIGIFDPRYLTAQAKPITEFGEHSNIQSRNLGLSVWQDQILAAAGDDGLVRLWSIESGKRIPTATKKGSNPNFPNSSRTLQHGEVLQDLPIAFREAGMSEPHLWLGDQRSFTEWRTILPKRV